MKLRSVIIAYDIEENKKRNKIYDKLKDFSLNPIQKSVFFGNISALEEEKLFQWLKNELQSNKNDKLLILHVKKDDVLNERIINMDKNLFIDKCIEIL